MVWEQGSVVIVMLTRLTENGEAMCYRYWPEEGSDLYHIYEVSTFTLGNEDSAFILSPGRFLLIFCVFKFSETFLIFSVIWYTGL